MRKFKVRLNGWIIDKNGKIVKYVYSVEDDEGNQTLYTLPTKVSDYQDLIVEHLMKVEKMRRLQTQWEISMNETEIESLINKFKKGKVVKIAGLNNTVK